MTKRFASLLLCLLAAVSVGACQTVADKRKIDYKATRTLPPLDIPPDLTATEAATAPEQGTPGAATYSGFVSGEGQRKPGDSDVLPAYPGLKLERAGQIRWLVVMLPAEQLLAQTRPATPGYARCDRDDPAPSAGSWLYLFGLDHCQRTGTQLVVSSGGRLHSS